jgi:hypothetical protein
MRDVRNSCRFWHCWRLASGAMTVDELARRFRAPGDFPARKQRTSTVLQGLASRGDACALDQVPDAECRLVNRWVITAAGRARLYRELLGRPAPVPPKKTYLPRRSKRT